MRQQREQLSATALTLLQRRARPNDSKNPPSHRWGVIIVGLGLLLLLTMNGSARAADAPDLSVTVKAGFQGNYRNAEWFGVQVQLTNDGDTDRSGTLTLTSKTELRAASREVSLPGHSRKQVWLYAVSGSYNGSIQLILQQGGDTLLQRDISLSFNDQSTFIMAVLGSDGSALNILSGVPLGEQDGLNTPRTTVAHIGLDEVPPVAAALDGLDALVIADADSSQLSEDQRAAIRAWVVSGGDLVVAGGVSGVSNATAFADVLPVAVGAAQPINDLSALAGVITSTEPITLSGQVVASVAHLQPNASALATSADGNVLLAQRRYGRGRISYIGVDPNLAALRAWGGYPRLWQTLFAAHYSGKSFTAVNLSNYNYGFSLLPQLDLPNPGVLFIVLLVYIIVVGPLNYLLLRQFNRREFAWLTTPLITLLFAAVFYAIGYQSKGGDVLVSRSSVVFASSVGDDATVAGNLSIFSPGRSSYTVQLSDTALAAQSNVAGRSVSGSTDSFAQLQLGSPNALTGLNIATWSQGQVAIADSIKLPPQFSATLAGSGAGLKVTVKNISTQVYSDAVLYAPSEQYASAPFPLAAGESKEVALSKKYTRVDELYNYLSGDISSALGYSTGSGGTAMYYYPGPTLNRGAISAAQRQQQARDQLVGTLMSSREFGLGLPQMSNGYYPGGGNNLPPSKDTQIYIAAWSNHDYLPGSLNVTMPPPLDVTLYVAPVTALQKL